MLKNNFLKTCVFLSIVCLNPCVTLNVDAAEFLTITSSQNFDYLGANNQANSFIDKEHDSNMVLFKTTDTSGTNKAVFITGSTDKFIQFFKKGTEYDNLLCIDYNSGYGDSIGIENDAGGTTTTIDSDYGISIYNNPFNGYPSTSGINNQYAVYNKDGRLTINSSLTIDAGSDAANFVGLKNEYGATLITGSKVSINGFSTYRGTGVENYGFFQAFGTRFDIDAVKNGVLNYGNAEINVAHLYINCASDDTAVSNSGDLRVVAEGSSRIYGNIVHDSTANTYVYLSGEYDPELEAMRDTVFKGKVLGSDSNNNFNLLLKQGATWITENQTDVISGLTLDGGVVALTKDTMSWWSPYTDWDDTYSRLRVKNANIINTTDGGFIVYTDLANNIGDGVMFEGALPGGDVPFLIINKDDNGGVPIKKEDGKSVTIASANDINTTMSVKSQGLYLGRDAGFYRAIIEEEMAGGFKNWNFVGWERGGNKTPNKESDQQKDGFDLNATELDNIFKRLNDIRTDPSEIGVWVRGENGKMKIRSYSYDYSIMSGGYDWDFDSNAAKMFLGFGISYAKNDCDTGIIGNTKSMGYNLYGSWLGKENKDYVDVIVKYGTLDKDYAGFDDNNVFVTGDYDKNLFSIAAKYGRRIEREDGWYWEPSVGLTWGRIGSADYTDSQGIKIHADSSTSKMASLGVQVGKNIKGTEYYGKFEVRHDFDGKMHVSVPGSNLPGSSVYDDMGGTWYKVGIGAARKIDKNNSFYIDIEKDFGNKVKKPYSIGAGYRYTW